VVALSSPQKGNADLSLQRAALFFEVGLYDSALFHYDRALREFKTQAYLQKYVMALNGKAYTLIKVRAYDEAKTLLDSALRTSKRSFGKSEEQALTYFVYGVLLDLTNHPVASLEMHQRGLGLRKELLGQQHILVSESCNGI
jgi:tetratricopeptide (TPR) repeat protein